ncbi:metal-dependent hydrolase family protein [Microbacterium marinilacus]|uniref:Amidohydrolase family protein n=1 Tax=Microbacterium marinilacus TaxID=415209 RepID=A0ABP7BQZ9_9MICO|nr:amidohydrolase family protein [Microbacterium marinilacus]MBY0690248.1 amidohydrolase family protein [Microbacterium marinilacus]
MHPTATPTLYVADRLLHTDPVSVVGNGGVLVRDGLIAWAGPMSEYDAAIADDVVREELGDVTLMPGLIDAHVHLGFDGGDDPVGRMRRESDVEQAMLMLRSARELLGAGVTTARDLGARGYLDVAVRRAIEDGTAEGPRLLTAGAPLTVTGGHCWFMGGEVDDEGEARKAVRRHHKRGVDLIKVMSTGGYMTPGSAPWHTQFTDGQLAAIVGEAHRLGKQVAAHCHGVEGIRAALAAGVDTLEHCSFTSPDGGSELDPRLVDAIAASPSYVSPTMNVDVRAKMAAEGWEPAVAELYRRGAKIIASTDAGIAHTPHGDYAAGLEALAQAGLPPREVLVAATSRAADALGLSGVTGRLAAGLSADLIAVDGDPTVDLSVLRAPRLVVARGLRFALPEPRAAFARVPA